MKPHANRSSATDPRALGLLAVAALVLASCGGEDSKGLLDTASTVEVTRGPLRIAVLEGGDLESANPISIRSEVEGRNAITYLIPEGSYVEEGTLICELDSSALEDRLNDQEISLERARSELVQAQEALAIQRKSNEEDLLRAETDLELAENALEAYVEGKYVIEEQDLEAQITLKEAQLKQAEEVAAASERLFKKDFIPKTELDRDKLDRQRAKQELEVARRKLQQLQKWDKRDEITRLQTDVSVKKLALSRTKKQGESELAQKKDSVATRKRNFDIEVDKRDKLVLQKENCTIHAPTSGLVVYGKRGGRRGDDDPVEVGTEVREREEILRLPDLRDLVVEVEVHESQIKKVKKGQRAWVTVDALPGRTFPGTVVSVGLVPSSQSSWLNPDLKVYATRVSLEETVDGLKPGMHAQVEIIVQELEEATQVPLAAVHQVKNQSFAYVDQGEGKPPELRRIEVGLNSDSTVHVTSGLQPGERVFLALPPDAPSLPKPEEIESDRRPGSGGGGGPGSSPEGRGEGASGPMDDGNLPTGGPGGSGSGETGSRRPGGSMSPEQMKKMRERLANMSEEERKALRERMSKRREAADGEEDG